MNRLVKYEVLCHRSQRFGQLQRTDPVVSTRQLSSKQSLTSSRLWQIQIQGPSHPIQYLYFTSRVARKPSSSDSSNSTNFLFWTHQLQSPNNQQPTSPFFDRNCLHTLSPAPLPHQQQIPSSQLSDLTLWEKLYRDVIVSSDNQHFPVRCSIRCDKGSQTWDVQTEE